MAKTKRSKKPFINNPDLMRGPLTPDPGPQDRMMRYRRNPACPECGAHPVVCMMRDRDAAYFRCRQCGHRWTEQRTPGVK